MLGAKTGFLILLILMYVLSNAQLEYQEAKRVNGGILQEDEPPPATSKLKFPKIQVTEEP